MLDARFSHLYFCQSLYTLQRGLPAIAGLLVSDFPANQLPKFYPLPSRLGDLGKRCNIISYEL